MTNRAPQSYLCWGATGRVPERIAADTMRDAADKYARRYDLSIDVTVHVAELRDVRDFRVAIAP